MNYDRNDIVLTKGNLYEMIRGNFETKQIWIKGCELLPAHSQRIYNHSPDGFNWGYLGSGCAQLSLGILLEFMPEEETIECYQKFKRDIIANLPRKDFELSVNLVKDWIKKNCFGARR